MNSDHLLNLLHQPISKLNLSQALKQVSEMNGYHTLAQLSDRSTDDLLKLPGFTRHILYEYINFMEANGFGDLIDPL